ncbi:hypothetical protein GIB67_000407 [Kingdonia uniflora]|uniref:Glycoside hydrolase family 38 N-terminal domain-containing protein n=1 Tax=Kingdonia uniflora TaxID=39325 RepID=A0A7J7MPW6_9MAGN|nr:hypothetical protein GIB67_000407 [Kingdonia uniflora]
MKVIQHKWRRALGEDDAEDESEDMTKAEREDQALTKATSMAELCDEDPDKASRQMKRSIYQTDAWAQSFSRTMKAAKRKLQEVVESVEACIRAERASLYSTQYCCQYLSSSYEVAHLPKRHGEESRHLEHHSRRKKSRWDMDIGDVVRRNIALSRDAVLCDECNKHLLEAEKGIQLLILISVVRVILDEQLSQLFECGYRSFRNGDMCMHDEVAPHYIDMIDQTTLGHQFIKKEFGQILRIGWQIDPFGHSAVQAYLSGPEIFASTFPENYEPPNGFYFEVNDASPVVQAARQLEYFKGRSSSGPNTDALVDALAIAQHHDACPLLNASYCPPSEVDLSPRECLVRFVPV